MAGDAVLDVAPLRAFLEDGHRGWALTLSELVEGSIAARHEPATDGEARREAKELLRILGDGGALAPIGARDLRACCLAREALGWASPLADAVWALQGLGITPLLIAGDDAQRERWAAPALTGAAMSGFAMSEPGAGSDVGAMSTTARLDGDAYVLDGHKWLISNAGIADYYVVFASTDPSSGSRGISAFVVPADTPGLEFGGAQVMSAPHPLGELNLEGCRIPVTHRIGDEGRGFMIGMATLDQLRPTVGAAACGMAARAHREAIDHAVRREQFGKPLADFQLIQEKLGRMAIELTASRLLVYRAAHEKDLGAERITTEAAMAKAYATESAQRIIDDAIQIVGGRAVLAEHPLDLLYRSVRALRIYEGTTEIQHLIIGGKLVAEAKARAAEGNSA